MNAVNTAVAALILAQSQGSLLIHVPDWRSFRPARLKLRLQLCLRLRWHAFSMALGLKMTERIRKEDRTAETAWGDEGLRG